MGAIISAIISGLFNAIFGIFDKKKAKSNEFAARSLDAQKKSTVDAKDMEVKIEEAQMNIPKPKTKEELEKLLGFGCVFLCLLCLPGCFETRVTVNEQKPVIRTKKPDKTLTEGPAVLTSRESAMGQYIGQLRAAIGAYNGLALTYNKRNGYAMDTLPPDSNYEIIFLDPASAVKPASSKIEIETEPKAETVIIPLSPKKEPEGASTKPLR